MIEAFWSIVLVDTFTYIVAGSFVLGCCIFLVSVMRRPGLATFFAPILMFSGLAANYVYKTAFVMPTSDKDTNVALASAVGVLLALLVLLAGFVLAVHFEERQSRKIEGRNMIPD